MKKTLIVYYSLGGSSEFLANKISEKLKCDQYKIELKGNSDKNVVLKFFSSLQQAFFKVKRALKPIDIDLNRYENIVVCSPVWITNISAPVKAFFELTKLEGKAVYLFYCYADGVVNMVEKFEAIISGNRLVFHMGFKTPFKNKAEISRQLEDVLKNIE